jgi:hypothetical protein
MVTLTITLDLRTFKQKCIPNTVDWQMVALRNNVISISAY